MRGSFVQDCEVCCNPWLVRLTRSRAGGISPSVKERGIGFEDVVFHLERGDLLDILGYSAGPMSFDVRRVIPDLNQSTCDGRRLEFDFQIQPEQPVCAAPRP